MIHFIALRTTKHKGWEQKKKKTDMDKKCVPQNTELGRVAREKTE